MTETFSMSNRGIDRLTLIKQVLEKRISQLEAARILHLSTRQLRRLIRRYQTEGPQGVSANNANSKDIQYRALNLIERDFYDYDRTLAAEKLDEYHGVTSRAFLKNLSRPILGETN